MQAQHRRGIRGPHGGPRAVQRSEQRVVVALADRVELMVVAPGARDRQTLEGLGQDVDLVVSPLDTLLPGVYGLVAQLDEPKVGGAENRFVDLAVRAEAGSLQQVARQVLAHQLVIGDIGVERADQVVSIPPSVGSGRIAFAPVGIGVADPVHPMPRPALPEAFGIQQSPHQSRVCIRSLVRDKGRDFARRGRQTGDIECQPADERAPVGGRRRIHALLFKACQHEVVHGIGGPVSALDLRRVELLDRLPRPMGVAPLLQIESLLG